MKFGNYKMGIMLFAIPAYLLMMAGCSTGSNGNRAVASEPDAMEQRGNDHGHDDHGHDDHHDDHGPGDEHGPGFDHPPAHDGDHHDVHVPAHIHDRVSFHGGHLPGNWRHWDHPNFLRPIYHFDWLRVSSVTCISQDSYGDQYQINEDSYRNRWENNMAAVEDEALDDCYNTSSAAASCFLVSCTPNY